MKPTRSSRFLLATAGQPDVPIHIVVILRSDYLGDCTLFSGLPEALNDGQYLTPRMTRDQRRRAIEGPGASAAGKSRRRWLPASSTIRHGVRIRCR